MDKDDVRWLLDYAIEGRRRVKEQLKIMAGVEFIDVRSLGYMDADNPQDVHVVRVPEQSEDTLIPDGPLLSGHVFGVGRSQGGEVAVYRSTRPLPASASLSTRAWPLTSRCAIRWRPRSTTL